MELTLISPNDLRLNQTAIPIKIDDLKSGKFNDLIDSMIKFARGEQDDNQKKVLVGLAAPQIGHLVQIILVDIAADGKGKTGNLQVFVNPEISWTSNEQNEWYEGCFSAGNITGIVQRPTKIKIKAYDRFGNLLNNEYSGYTARIWQHERDHLDGIRFPDKISDPEKLHFVETGQWPEYRNGEGWKNWPHKATVLDWKKIKGE